MWHLRYFLSEFVSEFSGNFEEVLDLAEEFKQYASPGAECHITSVHSPPRVPIWYSVTHFLFSFFVVPPSISSRIRGRHPGA
jgi:hypothetical protein